MPNDWLEPIYATTSKKRNVVPNDSLVTPNVQSDFAPAIEAEILSFSHTIFESIGIGKIGADSAVVLGIQSKI